MARVVTRINDELAAPDDDVGASRRESTTVDTVPIGADRTPGRDRSVR